MKTKLLLFLLLPCFSLAGCAQKWEPSPKRQPDLYLVPNGYVGWLHVEYGVKGAPSLPVRWGYRVYKFSRSGKIRTSSPLLFGWAKDKIYYTTPKGWKELKVTLNEGAGMVWGETLSGSANPVVTKFDAKGNRTEIPVPATSDKFIGTWKQFYHRKTEAPRSKEEEAALKED